MAEHLYTYVDPTNEKHLERACYFLERGGLVAYPTDVNWAVGCDPAKAKALKRIQALKPEHPKEKPFSLICQDVSMVASVAVVDQWAYRMLRKALPGPYTILLKPQKKFARMLCEKRQLLGVRVPNSPLLLDLVKLYGNPIATSSLVFPEKTYHYGSELEMDIGHALDLILDLGEEVSPYETSIVDLSDDAPQIIREGKGQTAFFS